MTDRNHFNKPGGNNQHYRTPEYVADYFGISLSYVRQRIRKGTLPYIKVGRHYRLDVLEVEEVFKRETECA